MRWPKQPLSILLFLVPSSYILRPSPRCAGFQAFLQGWFHRRQIFVLYHPPTSTRTTMQFFSALFATLVLLISHSFVHALPAPIILKPGSLFGRPYNLRATRRDASSENHLTASRLLEVHDEPLDRAARFQIAQTRSSVFRRDDGAAAESSAENRLSYEDASPPPPVASSVQSQASPTPTATVSPTAASNLPVSKPRGASHAVKQRKNSHKKGREGKVGMKKSLQVRKE